MPVTAMVLLLLIIITMVIIVVVLVVLVVLLVSLLLLSLSRPLPSAVFRSFWLLSSFAVLLVTTEI